MGGLRGVDPFSWDVAAVAQALCAPGSPWTRDPTALAAHIQDEEIDGKTLLTFEHVCSRQELMDCLGVKLARHKAALGEAIVNFQSRSRAYHDWRKDFFRKQAGYFEEDELPLAQEPVNAPAQRHEIPSATVTAPTIPAADREPSATVTISASTDPVNEASEPPSESIGRTLEIMLLMHQAKQPELEPQPAPRPDPLQTASTQDEQPGPQVESNTETQSDSQPAGPSGPAQAEVGSGQVRPPKRKRLAPVTLDTRPLNAAPAFIPTEADVVGQPLQMEGGNINELPWEHSSPYSYLGGGLLSSHSIKSPSGSLSSRLVDWGDGSFATSVPHVLPPGRRMVVHRFMKQLLRKNSRQEKHQREGREVSQPSSLADPDEVLELHDIPDDLDEGTLREMEEERAENEAREAQQRMHFLPREAVEAILNNAVELMVTSWQENNLPICQRKAYSLWNKARRSQTKQWEIEVAHSNAKRCKARIEKMCLEIMDARWSTEAKVRAQARILEQDVENKQRYLWYMNMLSSSAQPPKPQTLPRPRPRAVEKVEDLNEEVLYSSEDETGDFIVQGGEEDTPHDDFMDTAPDLNPDGPLPLQEPVKEKAPEFIDLTQVEDLGDSVDEHTYIDLISPVKPSQQPQDNAQDSTQDDAQVEDNQEVLPLRLSEKDSAVDPNRKIEMPVEPFANLGEIGAFPPSHWQKESRRWELVLCMLWRLQHSRRTALLDLLRCRPRPDSWDASIEMYINCPLEDLGQLEDENSATVSFDVSRIFQSFIKVKAYSETRFLRLSSGRIKKLRRYRDSAYPMFCTFILQHTPYFPQDSQIYRAEAVDDMLVDDMDKDLEDALNETQRGRQTKRKEIVQNKEAVDLRERDHQRVREQEARAALLRAKFASSGEMSRDRARLIINESKEEHQALIYVNDRIGKDIKQHQVDGVRFFWNQLVLDSKTRQGCLLAHTMGLGKTMQVITFLVALAESAASNDPSVVSQIPEDFRASRTLVLCPSSMVNNWMDEFLFWAPTDSLGALRTVASVMSEAERHAEINNWAQDGGVLIIGYTMFLLVSNMSDDMKDMLHNTPAIVVADEAHFIKNRTSQTHIACSQFKTTSRIALTGSPLANNVLDYQAMIDWVAPNYLGPLAEFTDIYANPIQQGLWHDSTAYEKRKALKKLKALKEIVAPKVHRRTIACLKSDLPPKKEFILSVPPTAVQRRLYELLLNGIAAEYGGDDAPKLPPAQLFSITNHLGLICSHPRCFQLKVEKARTEVRSDTSFPKGIIPQVLKALGGVNTENPSLSWKTELLCIILDEARAADDKVLVFSQSLLTLNYLENMCKVQKRRVARLDGSTAVEKRQELVKDFNANDKEVFLISTTAGGVGLNIQGANRVVIFDIKWNPTIDQQAIGRAYRIGQNKEVFVYRFMVAGTFEENLHNKHVFKMQLASRVVDEKNPISWSKRRGELLAHIKPKPSQDLKGFAGKDHILDKLIAWRSHGEAVRSIISTDTFEEEDPDVELTAEERKEVDAMIQMNQLISDPIAYQKAKADLDRRQQILAMAGIDIPQPSISSLGAAPLQAHQSFDGSSDTSQTLNMASRPTEQQSWKTFSGAFLPGTSNSVPPVGLNLCMALTAYANLDQAVSGSAPSSQPPLGISGPAPLPLAGANTYFGGSTPSVTADNPTRTVSNPMIPGTTTVKLGTDATGRSNVAAANTSSSTRTTPPPSSAPPASTTGVAGPSPTSRTGTQQGISKIAGFFSQPQLAAKQEFQRRYEERVRHLQQRDLPRTTGPPDTMARQLTQSVHECRQEKAFGFLPDNKHWKHLYELLVHDKFVLAITTGHLSAEYLALTEHDELDQRIRIINEMRDKDIATQGSRRDKSPDPIV